MNGRTFLRWFHGLATVGWLVMLPITLATGLKYSVPFLVAISVWALVGAHWSAWQGTRAEEEAHEREE